MVFQSNGTERSNVNYLRLNIVIHLGILYQMKTTDNLHFISYLGYVRQYTSTGRPFCLCKVQACSNVCLIYNGLFGRPPLFIDNNLPIVYDSERMYRNSVLISYLETLA